MSPRADPATTYLRLRVTDPHAWYATAAGWHGWAVLAGRQTAQFTAVLTGLAATWTGTAATSAADHLRQLRHRLVVFRLLCWQADQAISEFATTVQRAHLQLTQVMAAAARHDLIIADDATVHPRATAPAAAPFFVLAPPTDAVQAELSAALDTAAHADATVADRLTEITTALHTTPRPPGAHRPDCTASPAEVNRWWNDLTVAQRLWLLTYEPLAVASLDGIPAADRDAANRLLLDDRRAELDRALATAHGREHDRLAGVKRGLDALAERLDADDRPRAYLLRLDLAGEGRVVVAIGDPDRADHVLTHVPGMASGLATLGAELSHAERVASRATELNPATSTSAVLWLDYDAPDFVDEATSARQAETAAPVLRRFQDGLRSGHDAGASHLTVLGHSYGSLVVGKAAGGAGLAADDVVLVGSPGVGVDSATRLRVPTGHVWSSTSRTDIIQYAAVSPHSVVRDLITAAVVPGIGPALAFGLPERDLWFGRNPTDPRFGAHVFGSQPDAGHLGYWEPGRPALDALAAITLGRTP